MSKKQELFNNKFLIGNKLLDDNINIFSIVTTTEFNDWKKGKYMFDYDNCQLIPINKVMKYKLEVDNKRFFTYNEFVNSDNDFYNHFIKSYPMDNNKTLYAFGYIEH